MQIDGAREFFSRITSLNGPSGARSGTLLSALTPQNQTADDSLFLSDIGKRLSVKVGESPSLVKKSKQEAELTIVDAEVRRADSFLSQIQKTYERMYKLAVTAQDESLPEHKKLSALQRVDMQFEMEDLRASLEEMPRKWDKGMSPASRMQKILSYDGTDAAGYWKFGDSSSVLSRMQDRIMNGEEWNVREAWSPYGFTRVAHNEAGEEYVEINEAEAWYAVGADESVYEHREGTYRTVPTVSKVLERSTPYVVMDAESAAEAAKLLEQEINSIKKWRDDVNKGKAMVTYENLSQRFPGRNITLNRPTFAADFIFSDGLYDAPGVYREAAEGVVYTEAELTQIQSIWRQLAEGDGSDISFTEKKTNKNGAADAGYVLDVLTKEEAELLSALVDNSEALKAYSENILYEVLRLTTLASRN